MVYRVVCLGVLLFARVLTAQTAQPPSPQSPSAQAPSTQAPSAQPQAGQSARPIDVWLDVDTSTGVTRERPRDIDDGLALIYAFHSPELTIHGVSVTYGNADIDDAVPIAQNIVTRFGPAGLGVYRGAAGPDDLSNPTPAVVALAQALSQRPLTILALGPATNVAAVIRQHPEVKKNIAAVVLCAARRPGFDFHPPGRPEVKFPDFNFEKDPAAMQLLIDSGVPIVFGGYEVSHDTWLTRTDLQGLAAAGTDTGKWIATTSDYWLTMWETALRLPGFNPFDALCVDYLTRPQSYDAVPMTAFVTQGPNDRAPGLIPATRPTKPYLVCLPTAPGQPAQVLYLTRPHDDVRARLIERLAGPGSRAGQR